MAEMGPVRYLSYFAEAAILNQQIPLTKQQVGAIN